MIQPTITQWIKVEDGMPQLCDRVLIMRKGFDRGDLGYLDTSGQWRYRSGQPVEVAVTHWSKFPDAPVDVEFGSLPQDEIDSVSTACFGPLGICRDILSRSLEKLSCMFVGGSSGPSGPVVRVLYNALPNELVFMWTDPPQSDEDRKAMSEFELVDEAVLKELRFEKMNNTVWQYRIDTQSTITAVKDTDDKLHVFINHLRTGSIPITWPEGVTHTRLYSLIAALAQDINNQ